MATIVFWWFSHDRHKTRLHIGQLVKDTSDKLKQASETDHNSDVSVSDTLILVNVFLYYTSSYSL